MTWQLPVTCSSRDRISVASLIRGMPGHRKTSHNTPLREGTRQIRSFKRERIRAEGKKSSTCYFNSNGFDAKRFIHEETGKCVNQHT